jgi:hypothetical protein
MMVLVLICLISKHKLGVVQLERRIMQVPNPPNFGAPG